MRLGTEVVELAGRAVVREDRVELFHAFVGQTGNTLGSGLVGGIKLEVEIHPHLWIHILKPLPSGIVWHGSTAGPCPDSNQTKKEHPHAGKVQMFTRFSNPLNRFLKPGHISDAHRNSAGSIGVASTERVAKDPTKKRRPRGGVRYVETKDIRRKDSSCRAWGRGIYRPRPSSLADPSPRSSCRCRGSSRDPC